MQIFFKPFNWENAPRLKIRNRVLSRILAAAARFLFDKILLRTPRSPPLEDLTVTKVRSLDKRIDSLWEKISNQYPMLVVRKNNPHSVTCSTCRVLVPKEDRQRLAGT